MEPITSLEVASAEVVRARIARLILGTIEIDRLTLGGVRLHSHQRSAVSRLRDSIREFGGAVLCDPVGTGKTFAALAVPSGAASMTIVAPAVLKEMWLRALSITERKATFVSFESLSRGSLPSSTSDFIIVDEAHHARNPKAKRFGVLAQLVARTDVLFLTATPIHNRRSDLLALLSLFLGERAACLSSVELAKCVIRRDDLEGSIEGMPATAPLMWVRVSDDARIPALLLSLPPPLPPRDGGDGGVLIARSLIREWASTDAALIGGLRRRILRAESMIAALSDGTFPSKQELMSWMAGDDAVQLGFAGMLAEAASNTTELVAVVRKHLDGLRRVLEVARCSRADDERVSMIRKIRAANQDKPIVAFSQYSDSVNGLFSKLSSDGKVAALSGAGARISGGAISRSEAIARFSPHASGRRPARRALEITLLLTTDLLSEGVNLQDAGVVIHLDLPWTPARMEQRLGRVARAGSLHERVHAYALMPPLSADAIVNMERILEQKMKAAGLITASFPALFPRPREDIRPTEPMRNETIRALASRWISSNRQSESAACVVAGVLSNANGFLAVIRAGKNIRTIASLDGRIGDDPNLVLQVMNQSSAIGVELSVPEVESAEADLLSWIEADRALSAEASLSRVTTPTRAAVTERVNRLVRDSRAHERACLADKAERALAAIAGTLGAHDEFRLRRICEEITDGNTLLDAIIENFHRELTRSHWKAQVLAMIVLSQR